MRKPILCGTWLNILFTFIFRQEWKCSYPVKFQCLSCSQGWYWSIMSFMADYQNATSGRCKISVFFLFFSTIYIFTTQLLSFKYTKVRFKYYYSFMLQLLIFVLLNINITTCFLGLVLLCLTPLSNISVILWLSVFTCGGNQITQRKPPTCRKSVTNFVV